MVVGPGPGGGDLEGPEASAADEAADCVQEAVAQRLRFGCRQVAVQNQQLQPGHEDAGGHGGVEPGCVQAAAVRGEIPVDCVLPGTDHVLDPDVDAVGAVGVGALAPPACRRAREVRGPEPVAPGALPPRAATSVWPSAHPIRRRRPRSQCARSGATRAGRMTRSRPQPAPTRSGHNVDPVAASVMALRLRRPHSI
jgi:hypothetical protein